MTHRQTLRTIVRHKRPRQTVNASSSNESPLHLTNSQSIERVPCIPGVVLGIPELAHGNPQLFVQLTCMIGSGLLGRGKRPRQNRISGLPSRVVANAE